MSGTQMITWFTPASRVANVGDAEVLFGGTHLLREFLDTAASVPGGRRVLLVAPFLDVTTLRDTSFFGFEATGRTDLVLITAPAAARGSAVRAIAGMPWRSLEVRSLRGLHSKLYVALPEQGAPAALLGSHNLTAAGATSNCEIGVLVQGRTADGRAVIAGLVEHVLNLRSRSRPILDSLSPFYNAA